MAAGPEAGVRGAVAQTSDQPGQSCGPAAPWADRRSPRGVIAAREVLTCPHHTAKKKIYIYIHIHIVTKSHDGCVELTSLW